MKTKEILILGAIGLGAYFLITKLSETKITTGYTSLTPQTLEQYQQQQQLQMQMQVYQKYPLISYLTYNIPKWMTSGASLFSSLGNTSLTGKLINSEYGV